MRYCGAVEQGLRAVSFDAFIRLLPYAYRRDRHLYPQNRICYFPGRFTRVPLLEIRFSEILQLETDRERLGTELGLDAAIHYNRTHHDPYEACFTPRLYRIVNRLYREDFTRFGYTMTEKPEEK